MRMTIAIPIMNQLSDAKPALASLRYMSSDQVEWLFIDNGSTDPVEKFIYSYLKPKRSNYIRNKENIGMVATMQQAFENCNTDVLALTHSDVFVYEKDWDRRVLSYFVKIDNLGGVGFFGAQGCGPVGERIQDVPNAGTMAGFSNMLEAEIHGMRLDEEYRSAGIFDGFMMIFNMKFLKENGGFDQRYQYHHIYDRDASLESLRRGYKNIVVNVPCHHMSGLTANRSDYQNWINQKTGMDHGDSYTHDSNSEIFREKWSEALPLYVENDFSFRTGTQGQWEYKGNKIINCVVPPPKMT